MSRKRRFPRSKRGPRKNASRRGSDRERGHRGRRKAAFTEEYRGRVQKNPRGFAFLIVEGDLDDVYVSPDDAIHLMQGDIVAFTLRQRGARTSAHILRVLKRATKEVFGFLTDGGDEYLLQTEEGDLHRLSHSIHAGQVGNWVIARVDKYPTRSKPGRVSVVENFGRDLKPRHDVRIAAGRFGLPTEFPDEVDAQAVLCRQHARREFDNPGRRRDLRDVPFVTIDGEDAKDFDDAVVVLKEFEGSPFVLRVAIADVAFFVTPGSSLDQAAYERATSTYFPGVCLPMLPESLSNDLCSLRPQEDKLAFTAELHFDKDGNRTAASFYESIIRTAARLTYTQVQEVFEQSPQRKAALDPLLPHIRNLRQLYRKLKALREKRGVLDFDLPEAAIDVDNDGVPVRCYQAPRFEAHKVIEEFMIAANSAVAQALAENEIPALYRVHEPPEAEKLDEVNRLLRGLGITEAIHEVSPQSFNRVLQMTHHLKGAGTLHQSILRLQKQAHYEPEPKGHFGLALADYTHFTSPIRRYPDIVVHRALKQLIGAEREADKAKEDPIPFDAMGQHTSDCERRSMDAERFVIRRKHCWYLQGRLGESFSGTVAGVTAKGLFVSLGDTCIEGFLPVDDLGGDYRFDERALALRRRNGHSYGIGDALRVRLDRVSVEDGEITLGLE